MNLILSIFYPIFVFINMYRWYFIVAIGLYIILTVTFKWARQAITAVFAILALFFCLSHLPHIYNTIGTLLREMETTTGAAADMYADYVTQNILSDDTLKPEEKLDKAIQYALSGKTDNSEAKLPTAEDKSFKETLDYMVNSTKWGAGIDGDGDPMPGPVDPVPEDANAFERFAANAKKFLSTIWYELKQLVT